MIKIYIPNNNLNERKYILNILFGEFLDLAYKIDVGSNNYMIVLQNGNKLIIEDHFFNKYPNNLEYLKLNNIPKIINYQRQSNNQFISEHDIPIIYGRDKLLIKKQQPKTIICGIDIFASSFFMLTRWEEYVNKNRDNHNRFPAYESLAFKHSFLNRPVVNEYIEMLWNMLAQLGINQKRKKQKYKILLTHDVDVPLKYPNWKSGIIEMAVDLIRRKDIILAFNNLLMKIKAGIKIQNDPFNTFDYLLDVSEKLGIKSYFFFMGKGQTKFDNMYNSNDIFIKGLVSKIKKRGHYIGIHSTYNAYNQKEQFSKEKKELENNLDTRITYGRTHFLRFDVPTTWQIMEDNDLAWDSTMGFADREGFRCGSCYEYSVFNIITREKLKLKEKPLIVMDGNFVTYQPDLDQLDVRKKIIYLLKKVKKYNGVFVFLWHNSSFNIDIWKRYKYLFEYVARRIGYPVPVCFGRVLLSFIFS